MHASICMERGGNLICFKKRGYPERGGSTLEETVVSLLLAIALQIKLALSLIIFYHILRNCLMMFISFNQLLHTFIILLQWMIGCVTLIDQVSLSEVLRYQSRSVFLLLVHLWKLMTNVQACVVMLLRPCLHHSNVYI